MHCILLSQFKNYFERIHRISIRKNFETAQNSSQHYFRYIKEKLIDFLDADCRNVKNERTVYRNYK